MAEAQLTELTELSPVPETFIARVAHCTLWRHLEQFATTLLGLTQAQYDRAINDAKPTDTKKNEATQNDAKQDDAKPNVWNSSTNVSTISFLILKDDSFRQEFVTTESVTRKNH